MKTLQNNFTTPGQSKQLLELGVPADSADCIRVIDTNVVFFIPDGRNVEYYIDKYNEERNVKAEPCWSVGRLIEICLKCSTIEQRQVRFFCYGDDDEYSLIDYAVTVLESGVMTNQMDFSKIYG